MGSIAIFWGVGRQMTKMNITFSLGNGVLNTALKLFPQKNPHRLNESQKTSFGGTFSPILAVLLDRLFPKEIGLTHVWTRANHVNFMKIDSKLQPVS